MSIKRLVSPSCRRRLLRSLSAGSAVAAFSGLPLRWTRPVVNAVLLPAHAQTTILCDVELAIGLFDQSDVALVEGGTFDAQDVQVRGKITPAPGALVPVMLSLYADGNLLGEAAVPALPNGEFVTVYFLGTAVGPPGGVEKFTAVYECTEASWSGTVNSNLTIP